MDTTTHLPSTLPADERAGGETLFAGLAIPYILGALMICAGLIVGGTIGLLVAGGSFLLLVVAVAFGIWSFISTDDD
jgi:type IV secretory pathway VirB3-like protein